jgi:hypothetical protein
MGLTFPEIAEQLNADNYRTRDGRKYTVDTVSQTWERGKIKYHMEYSNHNRLKVQHAIIGLMNEMVKGPRSSANARSELDNRCNSFANKIYLNALKEATQELNVKLQLNPYLDTRLSEHKLIESLIKIILTYEIDPKEFTDETLNILGSLLFHPDFPKARKL